MKCANCGKTDYTEAIEFDDGESFCRDCCEKAGMGKESLEAQVYHDYETILEKARKEVKEEIKGNIGLLRQYINELPQGTLITNENISYILFNEKQ